jgi:hypothetical protein
MGSVQVWHNRSISAKVFTGLHWRLLCPGGLSLFGLLRTAAVNDRGMEIRDDWLLSTIAIAKLAVGARELQAKKPM